MEYEAAIADVESHVLEGEMLSTQAAMALARGDALALDYAQRSLAHGRRVKDPQAVGPALGALARVLVELGRPADAVPLVDELLTLTDDEGRPLYYTWLIDLGWLLHDLGRDDPPPRTGRAPVWIEAGRLIANGELTAAAEFLDGTDLRSEAAYAHLRVAESLADEGRNAEAQPHLERALAFYRAVSAGAYVRRGEALLPASA
jgi:tetratricopeptide (TPR) repeat protein